MSQAATTRAAVSAGDYNPLSPEVRANPYPYYAALRRDSPVHQAFPGVPLYTVTRYEDVQKLVHTPEIFSSTALQILSQGGGVALTPNSGALAGHRLLEAPIMISVDPPDHTPMRGLVNRGFTPRRIAALEPRLREIAKECIDAVSSSGRMDLVSDLAIPFPVTVIAEMLGVEPDRTEQFKHWSDAIVLGLSGVSDRFSKEELCQAADEMADYIDRIAAERRASPRDDLISVLVQADGDRVLTPQQVLSFVVLLLVAGNETTTNLIGNAMKALLQHPEQMAEVRGNRELIPQMIEEALRYESPIQGLPRKALLDTTLAGTEIPKDAFIMVMFASANRDEKQFPDPDRFDIHRSSQGHLAFGHGVHFCLGASLARLEAKVAFETIFDRCDDLRLETSEIPLLESILLRGPESMLLSFRST